MHYASLWDGSQRACLFGAGSLTPMDRPAPDPRKLLDHWEEWERGETPPGRVMSDLKTGGIRELLQDLAAAAAAGGEGS